MNLADYINAEMAAAIPVGRDPVWAALERDMAEQFAALDKPLPWDLDDEQMAEGFVTEERR